MNIEDMKKLISEDKLIEFYHWAWKCCNKELEFNPNSTHPINWYNMGKSGMFGNPEEIPGLPSIFNGIKKTLLQKKYRYTIAPHILKSKLKLKLFKDKELWPSWTGKLKDNGTHLFLKNKDYPNLDFKYCWILEELK